MKLTKYLRSIAIATTMAIAACGGNGSGGGGLTHNELASQFVSALNTSSGYNVSLVKSSTLQYDYIVIYDADYNEYDAIDIGKYVPGMDPAAYFQSASTKIFFNLDYIPGYYDYQPYTYYDGYCDCYLTGYNSVWIEDTYRDPYTGYVFEKSQSTSKDLEKYAALAEEKVISNHADKVAEKFGLSVERSKEVVRLAMAWRKAGGKDLTNRDQDSFSKEMLGFSITEAKAAAAKYTTGDKAALDDLVEKAAVTNGTSPENVRQIIGDYFGVAK